MIALYLFHWDAFCESEIQAGVTFLDVVETDADNWGPSLYASITLPNLMVSLPHDSGLSKPSIPSQKANANLIGCSTPEDMACVLASVLLGGELSFYAAMDMYFNHNKHERRKRNDNED